MIITLNTPYMKNERMLLNAGVYEADRSKKAIGLRATDPETGEPICSLTAYMRGESEKLQDNQIMVKSYSENEGVARGLVDAGLGKIVGQSGSGLEVYILEVTNQELLDLMASTRDILKESRRREVRETLALTPEKAESAPAKKESAPITPEDAIHQLTSLNETDWNATPFETQCAIILAIPSDWFTEKRLLSTLNNNEKELPLAHRVGTNGLLHHMPLESLTRNVLTTRDWSETPPEQYNVLGHNLLMAPDKTPIEIITSDALLEVVRPGDSTLLEGIILLRKIHLLPIKPEFLKDSKALSDIVEEVSTICEEGGEPRTAAAARLWLDSLYALEPKKESSPESLLDAISHEKKVETTSTTATKAPAQENEITL